MAGMENNITTSEEQTDQNYFDFQNLALGFPELTTSKQNLHIFCRSDECPSKHSPSSRKTLQMPAQNTSPPVKLLAFILPLRIISAQSSL
jgi:hypothetical protein